MNLNVNGKRTHLMFKHINFGTTNSRIYLTKTSTLYTKESKYLHSILELVFLTSCERKVVNPSFDYMTYDLSLPGHRLLYNYSHQYWYILSISKCEST